MSGNISIPSNTVRVDDNYIWLNCMVDEETQEIVEKQFPKALFKDRLLSELPLNTPVMITVEDSGNLITDDLKLVSVDFSEKVSAAINELFIDEEMEDMNFGGMTSIFQREKE